MIHSEMVAWYPNFQVEQIVEPKPSSQKVGHQVLHHLELKQIHEQITLSWHTSQAPVYDQSPEVKQPVNIEDYILKEYRTVFYEKQST